MAPGNADSPDKNIGAANAAGADDADAETEPDAIGFFDAAAGSEAESSGAT